jgi:hypothetical protein
VLGALDTTYYLTVKRQVGTEVVEVETRLDAADFEKLWSVARRDVRKRRFFLEGWDVDFFRDADGQTYFAVARLLRQDV